MIARLHGTVHRLQPEKIVMDVAGVGYLVTVGPDAMEWLKDGHEQTAWIYTYVREDRLDLFGFRNATTRSLFELLLQQSGIGPKIALELCAIPSEVLAHALEQNEPKLLSCVKGIGPKRATKLLVELRGLAEQHPELLRPAAGNGGANQQYDSDAVAALTALGYDTPTIIQTLRELPDDLASTEERVAAALRSL